MLGDCNRHVNSVGKWIIKSSKMSFDYYQKLNYSKIHNSEATLLPNLLKRINKTYKLKEKKKKLNKKEVNKNN